MSTAHNYSESIHIGLQINLRKSKTMADAIRINNIEEWKKLIKSVRDGLAASTANERIEVRIIEADGLYKDMTFDDFEKLLKSN